VLLLARIILAIAINMLALWVANALWDSVDIHGFWAYFIGAVVLGIANAVIKPILAILTLPLIVLTGFFGQNFGWLVRHVGSLTAFLLLGLALPVAAATLLIYYLRRQRLL